MRIEQEILMRHYTDAAIEQVASDYEARGYEVEREASLQDHVADLVVRKGEETILFEFKSGGWSDSKIDAVQRLRNYAVHELGADFRLVMVNLPAETRIEVENLGHVLFELVIEEASLYDELATHTEIDYVSDIEFDLIIVRRDSVELKGSATVSLTLQFGSYGDVRRGDGLRVADSFPLGFHILLDRDLRVIEVANLDLDTSSY